MFFQLARCIILIDILLSVRQIKNMFGVHSLYRWENQKLIKALRTPGGKRRKKEGD